MKKLLLILLALVAPLSAQTIYPYVQRGSSTALGSTRVPFSDSSGRLVDASGLTFGSDTLTLTSTSTSLPRGFSNVQVSSGTDSANFSSYKARGSVGSLSTIVTGDILGNWRSWGHDGTGYIQSANIRAVSTGTIATNRVPSVLEFYTSTDAAPSVLTKAFDIGPTQALRFPSTNTTGIQLYNTSDQTTDYTRLEAIWSGNSAFVRSIAAGTGTARNLVLQAISPSSAHASSITLGAGAGVGTSFTKGSTQSTAFNWYAFSNTASSSTSGTNNFLSITPTYNQASGNAANTDLLIQRTETAVGSGTQNLIQAGTAASPSLFTVSNLGTVVAAGNMRVAGSSEFSFSSQSKITSASDGVMRVSNNAGTDFTRLQFGGTTSSFPSLKRSGGELHVRLADDSAYANLQAATISANTSLLFGGVSVRAGSGSPESAVTANVGSLFMRTDGGASTTLYVKESGTGNTGWKAVQTAAP